MPTALLPPCLFLVILSTQNLFITLYLKPSFPQQGPWFFYCWKGRDMPSMNAPSALLLCSGFTSVCLASFCACLISPLLLCIFKAWKNGILFTSFLSPSSRVDRPGLGLAAIWCLASWNVTERQCWGNLWTHMLGVWDFSSSSKELWGLGSIEFKIVWFFKKYGIAKGDKYFVSHTCPIRAWVTRLLPRVVKINLFPTVTPLWLALYSLGRSRCLHSRKLRYISQRLWTWRGE